MSMVKSWFGVFGLVILGATGCTQPVGVAQPAAATTKRDAGKPKKKDSGLDVAVGSTTGDHDESGDEEDDEGAAEDGKGDDIHGGEREGDDHAPVKVDAGASKEAGATKDAGSSKDAGGGSAATDRPAPCPGAYMCQDPAKTLKDFGVQGTVTDAEDKPVPFTCSKGAQETCDPQDPKKSCPNLPNAFCAHVVLPAPIAMDFYNCAQLCAP